MTGVAIREGLPEQSGLFSEGGSLADLMWLVEMEHNGWLVTIRGIIKPDLSATEPTAVQDGFMESYNKIIAILGAAGAIFYDRPELHLTGHAVYRISTGGQAHFTDMKAEITIRLHVP